MGYYPVLRLKLMYIMSAKARDKRVHTVFCHLHEF